MSWLPKNDTNAVETMIMEVNYENAFKKIDFSQVIRESKERCSSMGFDTIDPILGFEAIIYDSPRMKSFSRQTANDGILMRKYIDETIDEEIGLHIQRFHYLTNAYVSWNLTKNRIIETMLPVLSKSLEYNNIQDINVITLNRFLYTGSQKHGNFTLFNENIRELIPPNPFEDRINWSYDFNWIKENQTDTLRVSQGIDFDNYFESNQYKESEISIDMKVKQEFSDLTLDNGNFSEILERLYKQSVKELGSSLSLEGQKLIGINSKTNQN